MSVTPLPYLRNMEAVVGVLGLAVVGLVTALVIVLARAPRADAEPDVPIDLVVQEAVDARAAADRAAMSGAVEQLVRMNQEMMDAERRLGTQELDGTRGLIDQQMGNMRVELAKLTGLLHEVERERREHVGELSSQLREAGRHTQVLAETTQSLREALSSTTARGQWGERMAEDVLRLAGFIDGVNYRKQQALAGSGGIPDYTFLLPQGLCLHMDVKFPLNNYMRFLDAQTDAERERLRKEFLKDVRLRLKEVTRRDYVDTANDTVDCVLLFIPNEQVYAFIQEQDRTILDDALRDKVIFCSPLTLFAVLAVIRQARRQLPLESDVARDPRAPPGVPEAVGPLRRTDGQGRAQPAHGRYRVRGARGHAPARGGTRAGEDRDRPSQPGRRDPRRGHVRRRDGHTGWRCRQRATARAGRVDAPASMRSVSCASRS